MNSDNSFNISKLQIFECQYCNAKLKTKANLRRHIKQYCKVLKNQWSYKFKK